MRDRLRKTRNIGVGSYVLGALLLLAPMVRAWAAVANDAAIAQKVTSFVRERFGLLDSVKLTMDPLRPFSHPGFLESTLTSNDGKQSKTNKVYLTQDRRYLIIGNILPLTSNPQEEIVQLIQKQFKVPADMKVTVGPFRNSRYPNLLATTITVVEAKKNQVQDFYVTQDQRWLVLGSVFDLSVDRRHEVLSIIRTENHPSLGPANAPVTIVEYADLQCASCAHMHELLEKQVIPKYNGKVRVVFKEFPIATIHDWALTGAVASQCAYQINPGAFVAFRSVILKNQASINATNAREMLLAYGEQVGIGRLQLGACMDAKSSLPRVEANFREGQAAGVQSTPTSFINGKMVVGVPPAETLYKYVEEALRAAR